ncbi:MAG: hypothetical protein H7322_05585 [Ramlibacter sp.]|nr:hypothetical protein [Ramlibacter sp.]
MTSRLTAFAALFAVLATATLTFAANATNPGVGPSAPAAKPVRVIQLERVEIIGHRLPKAGTATIIAAGAN